MGSAVRWCVRQFRLPLPQMHSYILYWIVANVERFGLSPCRIIESPGAWRHGFLSIVGRCLYDWGLSGVQWCGRSSTVAADGSRGGDGPDCLVTGRHAAPPCVHCR